MMTNPKQSQQQGRRYPEVAPMPALGAPSPYGSFTVYGNMQDGNDILNQPNADAFGTCTAQAAPYQGYSEEDSDLLMAQATRNSNRNQIFPVKLFFALEEVEKSNKDDIVSWMLHGRSFKVHSRDKFVKDILPSYFGQTSYASFQRQLNLYGFHRITTGELFMWNGWLCT